jgi:hypothetical protein
MKCFLLNFFTAERLAGEEAERLAGKENIITDIQRDEPTRRTYGTLGYQLLFATYQMSRRDMNNLLSPSSFDIPCSIFCGSSLPRPP